MLLFPAALLIVKMPLYLFLYTVPQIYAFYRVKINTENIDEILYRKYGSFPQTKSVSKICTSNTLYTRCTTSTYLPTLLTTRTLHATRTTRKLHLLLMKASVAQDLYLGTCVLV